MANGFSERSIDTVENEWLGPVVGFATAGFRMKQPEAAARPHTPTRTQSPIWRSSNDDDIIHFALAYWPCPIPHVASRCQRNDVMAEVVVGSDRAEDVRGVHAAC